MLNIGSGRSSNREYSHVVYQVGPWPLGQLPSPLGRMSGISGGPLVDELVLLTWDIC